MFPPPSSRIPLQLRTVLHYDVSFSSLFNRLIISESNKRNRRIECAWRERGRYRRIFQRCFGTRDETGRLRYSASRSAEIHRDSSVRPRYCFASYRAGSSTCYEFTITIVARAPFAHDKPLTSD